jgi:hypothetical protein
MPFFIIRAAPMGASVELAPLVGGHDRHCGPPSREFIVSRLGAVSQLIVPGLRKTARFRQKRMCRWQDRALTLVNL